MHFSDEPAGVSRWDPGVFPPASVPPWNDLKDGERAQCAGSGSGLPVLEPEARRPPCQPSVADFLGNLPPAPGGTPAWAGNGPVWWPGVS